MSLPVYSLEEIIDELHGYEIKTSDDLEYRIDEIIEGLLWVYYDDIFGNVYELYNMGYLDNIEGDLVENIHHAQYMYLKDEFYKHYDDLLKKLEIE